MSAFNSVPHITRCVFGGAIFTFNAQKTKKREMVKRKKKDESGDGQNDIVEKGSNSLMMGGFSALLSSFLMVDKKAKVSEALHYHRQLHIVA